MTRFLLTLDYELFFGSRHGTVERTITLPTTELAKCVEQQGMRLTLFVDACYLLRARAEAERHASVQRDYSQIARQLSELSARGHDVQLHVHPHWMDTEFDGHGWALDTRRYRLTDFEQQEIDEIVATSAALLEELKQGSVFAYRAGGWCIQPPEPILRALEASNIWLDSTVYRGGYSEVEGRAYDFSHAPDLPYWQFSDDPVVPDENGRFLEVPISACKYQISAFWRLVLKKLHSTQGDRPFGDGGVMRASTSYYLRRLISPTWSPVSIDATKAGLLKSVFRKHCESGPPAVFNVMGHPKSVTPNGIRELAAFLKQEQHRLEQATFESFVDLAPT